MKKNLLSRVDRLSLPPRLKRIVVSVLRFVLSPYYGWRIGALWPFFLGYAYALFPFEDMSVRYILRPAVRATAVEAMLIIAAIIGWVMLVSYTLDRRYDWHKKLSRRLVLQVWQGVMIPFALLLLYLWLAYGAEMMMTEYMHFVYALFVIFLVILNRQGYIVYLLNKIATHKKKIDTLTEELSLAHGQTQEAVTELRLAMERMHGLEEQLRIAQLENEKLHKEAEGLRERELTLVAELADKTAQLEIKLSQEPQRIYELCTPGKESRFFTQQEISRFQIVDRQNKKPIIYLILNTKEKILIPESSLTELAGIYTDMIHVGRNLLVGAHTLTGLSPETNGRNILKVDFQDEPIRVSMNRWKGISAKVTKALAERNKGI
ncbi:hypothetical protein [Sphingobacterium paucimobilis]|uniref:HTH LytTR-type domain-containing protein n=1 Tax=Sphingobacterium paucimobilis HER1398 TaxID=1346330 RepID=U2HPX6_9SPHI|nr:hypothetical protein [Sphingobacterium paucimobilis]ERJ57340.1 hypothetical protein M472_01035 [Sphingobacterium paucimobilis HER1398]